MNRITFLKALPVALVGLFVGKSVKAEEPQRIIEHIHINGDNAVISHNIIHGSDKQPAILMTKPVKLYDANNKLIIRTPPKEM